MSKAITFCLIIVGLINFLPILGIGSALQIEQAYAVIIESNDVEILLRHRALLFGIIGGFVVISAFKEHYQKPAMVMAAISMAGFIATVLTVGGYNDSINKILMIDVIGLLFLIAAAILKRRSKK